MRKHVIAVLVILICLPVYIFGKSQMIQTGNKIALLNIGGEITDTTHYLTLLQRYKNMKNVKAIVIRINSPGSHGMAASQEVYELVREISRGGKPVVVSMGNLAASGAYYISSAADKIVANSGTITGSIGVIMFFANAEVLLEKIGVGFTTIKTGQFKDVGSFSRTATPKELALLQSVLDDALDQFVDDIIDVRYTAIANANNITSDDEENKKKLTKKFVMENIADGRIFTGRQAFKNGIVDTIGTIDDAIKIAADLAGIKGRPMVMSEKKKTSFSQWLDSALSNIVIKSKMNILDNFIIK